MEETGAAEVRWRRTIGAHGGDRPGPLVVAVCGIHGNEPAGARAAETVLETLRRLAPPFRGDFVALAGNLEALERNHRYVEKDLNRQWTPERVEALGATPRSEDLGTEDRQLVEIWEALFPLLARSRGPAVLLDLHTSSADGPPFATMGDTLRNRRFVPKLPIPVILGLEEQIDGALLEYVNNLGHVTAGVEAGRHDLQSSIDCHEAVLWLSLVAAGCLRESDVPDLGAHRERLRRATEGLPRIVEVRYRHAIREGDGFVMAPGFRNFQKVAKGETLGSDRNGNVRARQSGLVLLPLYQGQGDDGFFLGHEVGPLSLRFSSFLHRLGAASLLRLLPGVHAHPQDAESLVVGPRAARCYPPHVFHFLGYRKRRWRDKQLILSRRRNA